MLKIFHAGSDYSVKLSDYLTAPVSITLLASSEIQVGFRKPINALYFEFNTANTNTATLSVKFYNGSSYVDVDGLIDMTEGFSKSEFVTWDRNQENQEKDTLNTLELYWYKLKLSADSSAMSIAGVNLVFSNDLNLKEEYPNIVADFLPENAVSFIGFHQAARKDIITRLRNQGNNVNSSDPKKSYKNLDQFDILDYTELTEASKFLALSKIFYWLSDAVDDKWYQKAQAYESQYGNKISLYYLQLDKDDDGITDNNERQAIQFVRIERV